MTPLNWSPSTNYIAAFTSIAVKEEPTKPLTDLYLSFFFFSVVLERNLFIKSVWRLLICDLTPLAHSIRQGQSEIYWLWLQTFVDLCSARPQWFITYIVSFIKGKKDEKIQFLMLLQQPSPFPAPLLSLVTSVKFTVGFCICFVWLFTYQRYR